MDFHSFNHLIRHVRHVQHIADQVLTASLVLSAETVLAEMKPMFGTYQSAAGGYAAWAPLAQETMLERISLGFSPNEPLKRTGDLAASYKVKSGEMWAGVGSTEEKALVMEVGDPGHNIPARSVLGIAFVRCEKKAFARVDSVGAFMMLGKIPTRAAIRLM